MQTLIVLNRFIAVLFTICYTYQFLYIPVSLLFRPKVTDLEPVIHDYAVLICARNEAMVIGDLIRCLQSQTYPQEHLHIFVMADNCTDETASIARSLGAAVYTRFDSVRVGKGYALEALLSHLKEDFPSGFDGYFVFDADNLLEPDYVEQMNRTFSCGHEIITSYRNSKNYGDNWISSGYALWFLRESRYLNYARFLLGSSCAVSGTGFLFSRNVAEEMETWPFHMLTEDIEFSIHQITKGRKIAFCRDAVLYDEQPTSFRQSWHQRMRWSRGYLQVFCGYGKKLLKGIRSGSFSCFDMSMTIMPAYCFSVISLFSNLILALAELLAGNGIGAVLLSFGELFFKMYLLLLILGAVTVVSEWKAIRTSAAGKILSVLTFPLFMFTYIPISIAALFRPITWTPISHTVTAKEFSERYSGNQS